MTLLETLAVLGMAGILAGTVVVGAGRQADRARVTLAQAAILDAYRAGRAAAETLNRGVEVVISQDSIVVRDPAHPERLPIRRRAGPGSVGVVATPATHTLTYAPSGLAVGVANTTHRLRRGTAERTVVVSRLGRLRVE
ncbi:MAG: hypothetical protein KF785_01755 [Gemmatimonadales bacterium]|nr:hypothetical protein [Gemmatimonadales bacterium]